MLYVYLSLRHSKNIVFMGTISNVICVNDISNSKNLIDIPFLIWNIK